jgi:hypothetical protein
MDAWSFVSNGQFLAGVDEGTLILSSFTAGFLLGDVKVTTYSKQDGSNSTVVLHNLLRWDLSHHDYSTDGIITALSGANYTGLVGNNWIIESPEWNFVASAEYVPMLKPFHGGQRFIVDPTKSNQPQLGTANMQVGLDFKLASSNYDSGETWVQQDFSSCRLNLQVPNVGGILNGFENSYIVALLQETIVRHVNSYSPSVQLSSGSIGFDYSYWNNQVDNQPKFMAFFHINGASQDVCTNINLAFLSVIGNAPNSLDNDARISQACSNLGRTSSSILSQLF